MKPRVVVIALALGLCAVRPAWAAPTRIFAPAWQSAPIAEDVKAAYPKALIGKGEGALVDLDCHFQPDGRLKQCIVAAVGDKDGRVDLECGFQSGGRQCADRRASSNQTFAQAALSLVNKFKAYTNPHQNLDGAETLIAIVFHDPTSPTVIDGADPEFLTAAGQNAPSPQFPQAAQRAGYAIGVGVVECTGTPVGALADCAIVSETPEGLGFGQIAMAAAASMRLNLWQFGEALVGARIRLPIYIDSGEPDAVKAAVREAVFRHLPGAEQLYKRFGPPGPFFPDRAARMGVNGAVTLECTLVATGALSDCSVRDVSAEGFGFEDASRKMAQMNLITALPKTVNGRPVERDAVLISIPFVDKGDR